MYRILFFIGLILRLYAQPVPDTIISLDHLLYSSRYEEVLKLTEALPDAPAERISLVNRRAEALIMLQRTKEAEALLQRELSGNPPGQYKGSLLATMGFLYLNQGRLDKSTELLQEAVILLTESRQLMERARSLSFLGLLYTSTGRYAQAEEQLQIALHLRQSVLPDNHELIAASYNDLGLAATATDPEKALDYFDNAFERYTAIHGREHPKAANTLINTGIAYRSMKLYGDAIHAFEEALNIWHKVYAANHPAKAFALANLGETYAAIGNYLAAESYFQQALAAFQAAYGTHHPELARIYILMGQLKAAEKLFDGALALYQQALKANVSGFDQDDPEVNPSGKKFYNGYQLLYAIMRKAQTFEARYFEKTLRQRDLEIALKQLHQCDSIIDQLRQQTAFESDKITLASIASEVYADGVRIAHELSEVAFRRRKFFREKSFYFSEKSKSAVLLDAISEANARAYAGLPPELLEEEKELKSALTLAYQKLAQKPDEHEEKYLRETILELNLSYNQLIRNLELEYPEYYNLKFNTTVPSLARLREKLSPGTAIVSYFIDDSGNRYRLYVLLITRKFLRIENHALPVNFEKLITAYRNSIYYHDRAEFIRISRVLYQLLIPKLPGAIQELVIIPSGRLAIIPFEAMLTRKVKDPSASYSILPYLNNRFAIRYDFSAGLILQKDVITYNLHSSAILCAPVDFPDNAGLQDLPGTDREIEELRKLFVAHNLPTNVWIREQASESRLKSESLTQYGIIHLATHGIVSEDSPALSCIYLKTDNDTEDGQLFAGEMYNLRFRANLVTLSACQTGLGKVTRGEGVIGLSRALVYAGAKNIVVSYWSVSDASTVLLMCEFYGHLLQNKGWHPSRALQQAKRNLTSGKYADPFYWAPFVLIGF
jgi:CHAT domain-containing protein/uncharacterized protein HemY